jgi:hypothetical protein
MHMVGFEPTRHNVHSFQDYRNNRSATCDTSAWMDLNHRLTLIKRTLLPIELQATAVTGLEPIILDLKSNVMPI